MKAKYAGTCRSCRGSIAAGEEIEWSRANGATHVSCPDGKVIQFPTRAKREMILSDEQRVIVQEAAHGTGSLIVQARAGTGKTYTIEACCQEIAENVSIKYMVFNKKNQLEAQKKLGSFQNVDVSTFHSAGFAATRSRLQLDNLVMDDGKVSKILGSLVEIGAVSEAENDAFGSDVIKLVHFAKSVGIGAGLTHDTDESWFGLIDHFGLSFSAPEGKDVWKGEEEKKVDRTSEEEEEAKEWDAGVDVEARAVEIARRILSVNNEVVKKDVQLDPNLEDLYGVLDFDDQIYQAVRLHARTPKFDIVFIDEVQDTSPIRRALAHMLVQPGTGRCISVGDDWQAIYAFTGADNDAMDQVKAEFNCKVLPLTVNYRCSKAVIREAQKWVPDIKWHDGAPEGRVETLDSWSIDQFTNRDAVLCRTNAPIVSLWYKCFKQAIPAQVLGRDLGAGLLSLLKKLRGKGRRNLSIEEIIERAEGYRVREVQKWTSKGEESKAKAAEDKIECLMIAIDSLDEDRRTYQGLRDRLEEFNGAGIDLREGSDSSDLPPRLTLSSIHRSKGLEWDRVFVLNWSQMPSKWAKLDYEILQELHCCYVAVTRARSDLFFLEDDVLADSSRGKPLAIRA